LDIEKKQKGGAKRFWHPHRCQSPFAPAAEPPCTLTVVVQGGTESPQGEEVVTPFLKKKGDGKTVLLPSGVFSRREEKKLPVGKPTGESETGAGCPVFYFLKPKS